MGYSTDFFGAIKIEPQITDELRDYLNRFADVRHMQRDVSKLEEKYKQVIGEGTSGPKAVLYPNGLNNKYGIEGEFFVGGEGDSGQRVDSTVIDQNTPPSTQPGLWCQWIVNDDGELEWDENEKFYDADSWMTYIIDKILAPNGYTCNGEIFAYGESNNDLWKITVKDNVVERYEGHIIYEDHPNYLFVKEEE